MFSIEQRNPIVVYHRAGQMVRHRSGRLMRPSDHMIHGHGLGEVDGILDTLKNLGSGIVKWTTAGLYDPSKNRFYVPFSSGQMRNWAQGITNTATLGLVQTDKFFNSNTMKTIGTIAGGIAAAGAAYAAGSFAVGKLGGGGSNILPSPPGTTPVTLPTQSLLSTVTGAVKSAGGTLLQTTKSLFSNVSAPSIDTVGKVLDIGSKVMGGVVGGGASQQQQQGGGQPSQVVMIGGGGGVVDPSLFTPGGSIMVGPGGTPIGYDPYGMGPMGGGGGVMMAPGGGGGFGPPGSEFVTDQGQMLEDPSQSLPTWILVGGGVILLYAMFSGKSKKK